MEDFNPTPPDYKSRFNSRLLPRIESGQYHIPHIDGAIRLLFLDQIGVWSVIGFALHSKTKREIVIIYSRDTEEIS